MQLPTRLLSGLNILVVFLIFDSYCDGFSELRFRMDSLFDIRCFPVSVRF